MALGGEPRIEWGQVSGLDSILAGVPSQITVPIHNSSWRRVGIADVQTTCGCMSVISYPSLIHAQKTGNIVIEALVDPNMPFVSQSLIVILSDGRSMRLPLQSDVVSAFSGWPSAVEALRDPESNLLNIQVADLYRQALHQIVVLGPDDEAIPSYYDSETGEIVIAPDGRVPHELLLTIGNGDGPNWAGPIVIMDPSKGES